MSYFCDCSSCSIGLYPIPEPKITDEEFKAFHAIDREIYSRLILSIGYNEAQATRIIALWIWLERQDHVHDLIYQMLSFPDTVLLSLAKEAICCLNCTEPDVFHDPNEIPVTSKLTNGGITLKFLCDNRVTVVHEVEKIVSEVCVRAFNDITRDSSVKAANASNNDRNQIHPPVAPMVSYEPGPGLQLTGSTSSDSNQSRYINAMLNGLCSSNTKYSEVDAAMILQSMNLEALGINEDSKSSSGVSHSHGVEEKEVAADDRTIFLTFSKGYRISATEVRDFFTRRYGECIDGIHMQEARGNEQPLYARLVLKNEGMIEVILDRKPKAKFTINGKHVWARKYVPKKGPSPY